MRNTSKDILQTLSNKKVMKESEEVIEYTITFEEGSELSKEYGGDFITEDKSEADDLFDEIKEEGKLEQVEQYFAKTWVKQDDDYFDNDFEESDVDVYYTKGDSINEATDNTKLTSYMCRCIADLFNNIAEDPNNYEKLEDWLEGGDSFYNDQDLTDEERKTLEDMLNKVGHYVDEAVATLCVDPLYESTSTESVSFEEIIDDMSGASEYSELYAAASNIVDPSIRSRVEEELGTCEDDGDSVDEAYSIVTSDILDMYRNEPNVLKENTKITESTNEIRDWFHKEYPNSIIGGDELDNFENNDKYLDYLNDWYNGTGDFQNDKWSDEDYEASLDGFKNYLKDVLRDQNSSLWVIPYPFEYGDLVDFNGTEYRFNNYEHSDGARCGLLDKDTYEEVRVGDSDYVPTKDLKLISKAEGNKDFSEILK